MDSARRELTVLAAERDRLAQRAAALSAELLRSEQALAELEELRTRVAQLEDEAVQAEREVELAYQQIYNLTRELDAVHATVSWRLTGVLRAARRVAVGSRPKR